MKRGASSPQSFEMNMHKNEILFIAIRVQGAYVKSDELSRHSARRYDCSLL